MNIVHGKAGNRLYNIWCQMKQRCYYKKGRAYKWYGAKGITVCDSWLADFMTFYNWAIDNGYNAKLQIERLDSTKDYCPSNCTWSDYHIQSRNRSSNVFLTYKGTTMCMKDWADKIGMKPITLRARVVVMNWSTERALTEPINNKIKTL